MSIVVYPTPTQLVKLGGTNLDAFGRLRVSNPLTLFDSQNRYALDPQFDTSLAGSGTATFASNESTANLNVTTVSGDSVIRQSKRVMPYQPGKSLLVLATFAMAAGKTGLRQRVGYFNADNGVFLQQDATTVSFIVRTYTGGSASDSRKVDQTSWNGDKLNGTGPSGITLDFTKTQILFMDFEWLGVGSVRCGFIIDGQFIVAHTFHNANSQTVVYMQTAILPVRYEITNTATTASNSTLKQICSSVIVEGGYEQQVVEQVARMTAETTVGTSFEPLVSIRLASDSLGAVVLPNLYSVLPTGTADYEVALIRNATLTGASYDTSTFTHVDYDVSATSMSGGTIIRSDFVSASNQSASVLAGVTGYNFAYQLGVTIGGTSDVVTLAARVLTGTDTIVGLLSFYDLTD